MESIQTFIGYISKIVNDATSFLKLVSLTFFPVTDKKKIYWNVGTKSLLSKAEIYWPPFFLREPMQCNIENNDDSIWSNIYKAISAINVYIQMM